MHRIRSMECKVCNSNMVKAFEHKVRGKYQSAYYKCSSCGFLCAEDPHWLAEAYTDSITDADTGLLTRNLDLSRKMAVLIYYMFKPDGYYLDYAGGYGVFTRLMRDAGFNFFHTDKYTENLFAKDLGWDLKTKIDGVTCFECFEHLVNPIQEIAEIVSISKLCFFSTELLPENIPSLSWGYYGFEHGQHISFYSHKTLQVIARRFGLHVESVGNFHLFSEVPVRRCRMRNLIRKADRIPHIFACKTTFETIAKKMRRQPKGIIG